MNEREILEESIANHELAVENAKRQLEDLDKPRHGDVKHGHIYVKNSLSDKTYVVTSGGIHLSLDGRKRFDGISGETECNIFDVLRDLKRESQEDLRGFTVDSVSVRIDIGCIDIRVWQDETEKTLVLSEAIEFHQKLGQVIATLKREKNDR